MTRTARRPQGPPLAGGVLIVDKPPHVTSHDVVAAVRRHTGGAKIGHTGTLDPFATGVLPLVVGKATRLAQHLTAGQKSYDADVRLGRTTDTLDITGQVLSEAPPDACRPTRAAVDDALAAFRGTWMQTPPAFSAKHHEGARVYDQARRGVAVDLPPVEVTVADLELLALEDGLIACAWSARPGSTCGPSPMRSAGDWGLAPAWRPSGAPGAAGSASTRPSRSSASCWTGRPRTCGRSARC